MKIGDASMPTTTALQARLPIFQPTDRPVTTAGGGEWTVTSWGRVRIAGRLGQRHADCLQALLHTALARRSTDDGSIELLVDPAAVRRTMSARGYSGLRLETLMRELRTCTIDLQAPALEAPWILGGLLDHVEKSPKTAPDPLGGVRHLLRVRLGKPLAILLQNDLLFTYDPAPIARLRHGITKAVVRHAKTHRDEPDGGWILDHLIAAVGGAAGGTALRNRRREIVADAPSLPACGVALVDGRLHFVENAPQPPASV